MTFILQRASGRGFALSQVRGSVLRIGRGTNAELRSENPAVALEHALITADVNGYAITDKGSITGTYVNGRPVESARLAKGDVIDIGDLRIEVQVADPAKAFFARVSAESAAAAPADEQRPPAVEQEASPIAGVGALKAKKIDYVDAYRLRRPYLTKLSLIAILLIVTLAVVGEVTKRERQTLFMPGGVSSAHSRFLINGQSIAKNCNACHDPWKGASADRCMACHKMDPHAALQRDAPKCTECHVEHRGAAKLASIGDAKCVACHSNLPAHRIPWGAGALPVVYDHISSFDDHPEFPAKTDNDTLHFNHRLHLAPAGVQNDRGVREVLKCESCHKLVESHGEFDPVAIKFETHCQRCHRLTFDPRFPNLEVPHGGDPQNALGYVAMTYTGNRDLLVKPIAEARRILAQRSNTTTDERAYINAQQVVRTKCSKCHDVRRDMHLALTAPVIRTRWFNGTRYTHTKHRSIDCEACHTTARKSAATSDVLLPTRSACEKCHGSHGALKTASTCLSCHKYHGRSKILTASMLAPIGDGKRMIEPILLLAIGILMLVVAIPVGIFIYQRLVASAPAIPTVKEMQAKAKPKPETAKVPSMPAPPPEAAPPPVRESTFVDPPPPSTPAIGTPGDSGGKTEMVQWYGMLLCTDGPLAGQRFVIEEEGLYIGREPSLAQIVIHDSRISKRHLRIVPRNGKVMAIDQNSTNGTYLGKAGGQRITEVQLKRGDVLVLSDNAASFQYQI